MLAVKSPVQKIIKKRLKIIEKRVVVKNKITELRKLDTSLSKQEASTHLELIGTIKREPKSQYNDGQGTYSIKSSSGKLVTNTKELSDEYIIVKKTRVADNKKIKKMINKGISVKGAFIEKNEHFSYREQD